jgi:hypothetical protein
MKEWYKSVHTRSVGYFYHVMFLYLDFCYKFFPLSKHVEAIDSQ